MKKLLAAANLLALLVTIVINYLSTAGIFGGNTIATVSAAFPTYFTPAPYAFSIWGLIYLGLLGFAIYQARALAGNTEAAVLVHQVNGWFLLSCIANCCWVLAFVYGHTGLSILCMIVLFISLFMIILRTDMELTDPPPRVIVFVWWPFCLYSGWISVALLANIAFWWRKMEFSALGIHAAIWAVIMVLAAGALGLLMTWKRNMREFALAEAWGLIAVGVANAYGARLVAIAAYLVAAILIISSGIHGYRNRATAPFRH